MTNILVLGKRGMLGSMLTKVFLGDSDFKVCATGSRIDDEAYLDALLGARDGLERLWQEKGPFDFIVNSIGVTADQIDETCPESVTRAIRLNALFPHELARWAQAYKARVIHISTDGVFAGKEGLYDERAPHECLDIYGRSKSLGEVYTQGVLNLRSSIIGPSPFYHRGLMEWFLSQPRGAEVSGYIDEYWNGVTTRQLAELIAVIIKEDRFDFLTHQSPVFHFAPFEAISKYELLKVFDDVFNRGISVVPVPSPRGAIKRVLTSCYGRLKIIAPSSLSLKEEIAKL